MFSIRSSLTVAAISSGLMFLAGCDDDDNNNSPVIQTGQFVDAAVAGIGYRTASREGVTDANGNYNFIRGEQVTFFIGDLTFPPVTAKGVVTPVDIAQESDGNATIASPVSINIARLLQSLDSDDNPANGITIDSALSPANSIDFTADTAAFEAAFTAEFSTETLITAAAAQAHLQAEINALNSGGSGGDNGGGTATQVCPFGGDPTSVAALPTALASQVIDTVATTVNSGAPFTLDQAVNFTFSGSGLLFIDNTEVAGATPYQCPASAAEYLWYDEASTTIYAVAVLNGAFHEISVLSDTGGFLAGLEAASAGGDPGAVANLNLVTALAGTYDVASTSGGTHDRGTITINDSGDIDFDVNTMFTVQQIVEIFDRTNITNEPRIQINYGNDDDGETIQVFLTPGDLTQIESIQYRHRTQSIEITATLAAPTFSITGSINNEGNFSGQWELFVDSVLVNDGSLATNPNVTFSLSAGVENGAAYVITVSNNECAVTNNRGTVSGAAIDDVVINCASASANNGSATPFTIAFAGPSLNADSCDPSQLTEFTGDTFRGQFNANVYSWNGDSDEPGAFMELALDTPNAGEYDMRFVCENLSHSWTTSGSESDADIAIDRTTKTVTFNNLVLTPSFNGLLQVDFQNNPDPIPASQLALTLNGSLADD